MTEITKPDTKPTAAAHDAPKAEAPKAETPSTDSTTLAPLPPTATLAEVIARVNELTSKGLVKRDRGPESSRTMVEADARRIMLGDLKDASHTKAAQDLGLSYGQVYSARKGFTFKAVYQEMLKVNRAAANSK